MILLELPRAPRWIQLGFAGFGLAFIGIVANIGVAVARLLDWPTVGVWQHVGNFGITFLLAAQGFRVTHLFWPSWRRSAVLGFLVGVLATLYTESPWAASGTPDVLDIPLGLAGAFLGAYCLSFVTRMHENVYPRRISPPVS